MALFVPSRILWPYGPLRILNSVFLVFLAVELYFLIPRFEKSPSLFATTVLVLFAGEVAAFERVVRRVIVPYRYSYVREVYLPPSVRIKLASQFALFADLTPAELKLIILAAYERHYAARETIFVEGDPVIRIWIVLSGLVKVVDWNNGDEVILRVSKAGEFVDKATRRVSFTQTFRAQAVQDSLLLEWDVSRFEEFLDEIPSFRRNVAHALEERLLEMEQRLQNLSSKEMASHFTELIRISERECTVAIEDLGAV